MFHHNVEKLIYMFKYSRLSLSRTRLSRITAYLEVNIWSLVLCVKRGTRFLLQDKRLFEISEFEITRVDCI